MLTLSQLILKAKLLDENQLFFLKQDAEKNSLSLAQWLHKKRTLPQAKITALLSELTHQTPFQWQDINESALCFDQLSLEHAEQWQSLLTKNPQGDFLLLMTDPTKYETLQQIKQSINQPITSQLISFEGFYQLLTQIKLTRPSTTNEDELASDEQVNQLLTDAVHRNASDIHIEPFKEHLSIRFREDGLLKNYLNIIGKKREHLMNKMKVMANLNIAETRLPQDGQCQALVNKQTIHLRVSTCPTIQGEKMVLRLLKHAQETHSPQSLGLNPKALALFLKAINQPQGLVLVCGPTGSGKTSTLYTALSYLNKTEKNIATAEDPVEIQIEGINQVNIKPSLGLDFETLLKTFLRQDPDIIMIGEIRDKETAATAIKAAQTGHLVLSTLHSNSSLKSLSRLKNLNISSFDIDETLNLIIAQRLLRKLCPYCKKGCSQCYQGYAGQLAIFEMLTYDEEKKTYTQHLKLKEDALDKVAQGLTTLEEVQRVLGE